MNIITWQERALLLAAAVIVGTHTVWAQQQQNFTGDGGKGISLTIYVPQSTGLAKDQSYIPALVQGEFVSNFLNYSAIPVTDWERMDDLYTKYIDEKYDDKAAAKQDVVLGRLTPTSHFLTGNITKTATGYNMKVNITATADKVTVATYSGTFTFAELDNLTGVRRASLELLQKVGVTLTEAARQELAGAAAENQVSAQTALAKGVTAQRAGTVVEALSYYYQAANFNPALNEAVKRSSVVAANISSGNIGADLRNDILWRKKWVAILQETEETVNKMMTMIMAKAANPPYMLTYFTDIKTDNVNYQTETADFSITMYIRANEAWFTGMRRTLEAADQATKVILDGLNATNRKSVWGLEEWPLKGVSNTNPFATIQHIYFYSQSSYLVKQKKYDIVLAFELVNQQGRVIGSSNFMPTDIGFNIHRNRQEGRFNVEDIGGGFYTVKFKGVKANDISDNLTIRIASVNKRPPQQAGFPIMARLLVESSPPLMLIDSRDGKRYNTVKIGGMTWMAENLNYLPQTGKSWCYDDDNSNCDKYGRLYDQNTANTVCPVGWHLSSLEEWDFLTNKVDGTDVAEKLKSKSGWNQNGNGTDDYGFSALPAGMREYRKSSKLGEYGFWWLSGTEKPYCMIYNKTKVFIVPDASTYTGYSVRCVAD